MDCRTDSFASLMGVRLVSSLLDRSSAGTQLQHSIKARLEARTALAPAIKQQRKLHSEVQKVEETMERLRDRAAVLHYRQALVRLATAEKLQGQLKEELQDRLAEIDQDAGVQALATELRTQKDELANLEKHSKLLRSRLNSLKACASSQTHDLVALREDLHSLRRLNHSLTQALDSRPPSHSRHFSLSDLHPSHTAKRKLPLLLLRGNTQRQTLSEAFGRRDRQDFFKACMDAWTREFRRSQLVKKHGRGLALYFESIRPVTCSPQPSSPASPAFPHLPPIQLLTCLALSSPLRERLQHLLFP